MTWVATPFARQVVSNSSLSDLSDSLVYRSLKMIFDVRSLCDFLGGCMEDVYHDSSAET